MKLIVLTAFNGRLQSEPMEWPNWPPYIYFPVSPAKFGKGYNFGKYADPTTPTVRNACFEATGKFYIMKSGQPPAQMYELVAF